jgi:hypothetical protein
MSRSPLWTAVAVALFAGPSAWAAQPVASGLVAPQTIAKAIRTLNEQDFEDVKANINCKTDRRPVVRIICRNRYLYDLATLNSKASAKLDENSGNRHENKGYGGIPPSTCRTFKCIYTFYKNEIDVSLGGLSPFADDQGTAPKP